MSLNTWVKVSTAFVRHPKALAAGPTGRHLYLVALLWSGEYATDGAVPAYALPVLAGDAGIPPEEAPAVADRLVDVGLWERTPDGWRVHDWADWQVSAQVRAEQLAASRERKRRWHEARRVRDASATRPERRREEEEEGDTEEEVEGEGDGLPIRRRQSRIDAPQRGTTDDDDVVVLAAKLVGSRRHDAAVRDGTVRGNTHRHRQTCIERAAVEFADEIASLASQGRSPEQIADEIQPVALDRVAAARARLAARKAGET